MSKQNKPAKVNNDYNLTRKDFIQSIAIGSVAINLPWLSACSRGLDDLGDISPLNSKQFETVRQLFQVLFPDDGNGPSALDVNADRYLLWVLNDPLMDPDENQYIIDKFDQFANECEAKNQYPFSELGEDDKIDYVTSVSEDWGQSWLSRLLTIIFEALLTDPRYGGNPNNIGWDWLNHDPGLPRPTDKTAYPNILER